VDGLRAYIVPLTCVVARLPASHYYFALVTPVQAAEDAFKEACAAEERAKQNAQQYLSAGQCTDLREFVSDPVRLQGMPQLNGAHFSIVEGEDVPDMVKAMVEQEADMIRGFGVETNVARLAGILSGKSHLLPCN
jgi:hypothetical protein